MIRWVYPSTARIRNAPHAHGPCAAASGSRPAAITGRGLCRAEALNSQQVTTQNHGPKITITNKRRKSQRAPRAQAGNQTPVEFERMLSTACPAPAPVGAAGEQFILSRGYIYIYIYSIYIYSPAPHDYIYI